MCLNSHRDDFGWFSPLSLVLAHTGYESTANKTKNSEWHQSWVLLKEQGFQGEQRGDGNPVRTWVEQKQGDGKRLPP